MESARGSSEISLGCKNRYFLDVRSSQSNFVRRDILLGNLLTRSIDSVRLVHMKRFEFACCMQFVFDTALR